MEQNTQNIELSIKKYQQVDEGLECRVAMAIDEQRTTSGGTSPEPKFKGQVEKNALLTKSAKDVVKKERYFIISGTKLQKVRCARYN